MKLTVIIPLYNRANYIGATLASLIRQGHECDLDILVVDDGSTDAGPEIVAEMARRHACVRMVRQDNTGVTGARNFARRHMLPETAFVSFIDSDDLSPPGRFTADLACFAVRPELQLTYGMLMLTKQIDESGLAPVVGSTTLIVRGVSLSSAIFRRDFFDGLGDFDDELNQAEDLDFMLRALESGAEIERTDTVCCYYRRHEGNMTNDKPTSQRFFLMARHKSLRRRRATPGLRDATGFFDLKAMQDLSDDW